MGRGIPLTLEITGGRRSLFRRSAVGARKAHDYISTLRLTKAVFSSLNVQLMFRSENMQNDKGCATRRVKVKRWAERPALNVESSVPQWPTMRKRARRPAVHIFEQLTR